MLKKFELVLVHYEDDRAKSVNRIEGDNLIELSLQIPTMFARVIDEVWNESKIEKTKEYDDNPELPF